MLYFPEPTAITKAGYVVSEVAEFGGLFKSGTDLINGDPQNLAYDLTEKQFEILLKGSRLERLVPGYGIVGNIVSLSLNLKPKVTWNWK